MPKIKSHKGATKRFKITKGKKILERRTPRDHFKARRTSKIKRGLKNPKRLSKSNTKHIKRLINK